MKKSLFTDNWTCNGTPVTVPHDAMLHGQRDPEAACKGAGAYFPDGSWVYEKTFDRPEAEHVLLQFEGVYKNAKVFLNGNEAGGTAYGYLPFFVDADPFLKEGENTIRVECAVQHPDSRWYSGAGIFRPVWLWEGPKDAIRPESVRISTVSCDPAVIRIQSPEEVSVRVEEICGTGTDFTLTIPDAKLWSDETPNLYTAHISNASDSEEISFGIRRIEWSPKGLLINGQETLLRGGCVHHDCGILGAAAWDEAEWRRVKKLKDAGFNAIRSAHNPCSRAMLEACDALGVYLMDECWDMWFHHKSRNDYASDWKEHYLADIDALVSRDFSHPSVILYSIGNEVSEPAKAEGVAFAKEMTEHLHRIDPTRPVSAGINLTILTQSSKGKYTWDPESGEKKNETEEKTEGMNSTLFNLMTSVIGTGMNKAANSKKADRATSPVLDVLDIAGYNYASGRYPLEGRAHPDRIIVGSETFPQDLPKNWEMVKKYPYLTGDFMWTAWDYIGEAGLGAWAYTPDGKVFDKPYPWLLADSGAMDILGDPTGELFLASAVWEKLERPAICVRPLGRPMKPVRGVWRGTNAVPSWSWRGCEGEKAVVEVYTRAPKVKLYLNGVRVGMKKVKGCQARFKVRYTPGTLTALACDKNGKELARGVLVSAARPEITLRPEQTEVPKGGVVFVPVLLADRKGRVESNADRTVTVTVEGGELLGFGSANPRTEERFDSGTYTTYYGRALAAVRAGGQEQLTVTATDGVSRASVIIPVR